jgi:hypothetical protein
MRKKEIWVSTKEHQANFNTVIQQNSWLRKSLGLYKLPTDFPYIRFLWQKSPIVYNKRFSLEINDDEIKLIPNNEFGLFNRAKNINVDTNQPMVINEVISKSRYQNPKPFMEMFNINWIQIKFFKEEKEEEMLLCAGGKFMSKMAKETNIIFEAIEDTVIQE